MHYIHDEARAWLFQNAILYEDIGPLIGNFSDHCHHSYLSCMTDSDFLVKGQVFADSPSDHDLLTPPQLSLLPPCVMCVSVSQHFTDWLTLFCAVMFLKCHSYSGCLKRSMV